MKRYISNFKYDFPASIVVFLVAVPLCLGIALASGAPLFSGLIAGIVGGIVVSIISKSDLSVTGPAAGLTAIVVAAINDLGSFETFQLAVIIAGAIQLLAGFLRAGSIAHYFPTNVIKGMLSAIGIIIILKQIPHALGYDKDAEGEMTFIQTDGQNTFSEILNVINKIDFGATFIAIVSILILVFWEKIPNKKLKLIPGALIAVIVSVLLNQIFVVTNSILALQTEHLVNIPISSSFQGFISQFHVPDFSNLFSFEVFSVAFTLAIVASIETLLSLEAIDKLDPENRISPPNRELKAQGVGNIISGLIGGLPITSVIVRSSANVNSGAKTKASAFYHGVLILISVAFIPVVLNKIPLAALASILIVTGFKLASPKIFKSMLKKDYHQWIPFFITIIAIVFTDLLTGVLIGLAISVVAVLRVNYKNPYFLQKAVHKNGETIKIELSQEISFMHKASITIMLDALPEKSNVILDGTKTKYIDPDVVEIIQDFRDEKAPAKNIKLLLTNFSEEFELTNMQLSSVEEKILDATHRTAELQKQLTPEKALHILKEGNFRFVNNLKINRNYLQQITKTSDSQYPFAVVLGCIDSRTSSELIFDVGLGDVFSIRIAGNICNEDILGSMEFACKVAGAKIIVVLGHTRCGAIKGACDHVRMGNLTTLVQKIEPAMKAEILTLANRNSNNSEFVENVAKLNVHLTVENIKQQSPILKEMLEKGEITMVGAMYDIETGLVSFYEGSPMETNNDK